MVVCHKPQKSTQYTLQQWSMQPIQVLWNQICMSCANTMAGPNTTSVQYRTYKLWYAHPPFTHKFVHRAELKAHWLFMILFVLLVLWLYTHSSYDRVQRNTRLDYRGNQSLVYFNQPTQVCVCSINWAHIFCLGPHTWLSRAGWENFRRAPSSAEQGDKHAYSHFMLPSKVNMCLCIKAHV